jgi:hypothetical protein
VQLPSAVSLSDTFLGVNEQAPNTGSMRVWGQRRVSQSSQTSVDQQALAQNSEDVKASETREIISPAPTRTPASDAASGSIPTPNLEPVSAPSPAPVAASPSTVTSVPALVSALAPAIAPPAPADPAASAVSVLEPPKAIPMSAVAAKDKSTSSVTAPESARGKDVDQLTPVTDAATRPPESSTLTPKVGKPAPPLSAMLAAAKASQKAPAVTHPPLQEITQRDGSAAEMPPEMVDPRSLAEALRFVVWKRAQVDFPPKHIVDAQIRHPIILANRAKIDEVDAAKRREKADVVAEVMSHPDAKKQGSMLDMKSVLAQHFARQQETLDEKVERLREEYLRLHIQWIEQCSKLESTHKVVATAVEEPPAPTGRTTRRSAATLGDAVRSDLELEQIISSLGNEDLTDPSILALRNLATIPDMISTRQGYAKTTYDDTNNLIDNPSDFYAPHSGFEDWTEEEKEIFKEKFAAYPKQFGIIAGSLPHKTPSQCVAYYYLHKKKHIDFRKVITNYAPAKRKRGGGGVGRRKGNALLADIRMHDAEVSVRKTRARKPGETTRPLSSRRKGPDLEDTPVSTPTPEPETKSRRRRTMPTPRTIAAADQEQEDEVDEVCGDFDSRESLSDVSFI